MTNDNAERPSKRARTVREHGPDDYAPCPCYKCQGAPQLRRTRADHKDRYPWPEPASDPHSSRNCSPTPGNRTHVDPTNASPSPQRSNSPSIQSRNHDWTLGQPPSRYPSPGLPIPDANQRALGSRAPDRRRRHAGPIDLPGFNLDDQQQHRFDDLLPRREFLDLDVDDELLGPMDENEDEEDENLLDDLLPRGPDHQREHEQPFVLPWGNPPGGDEDDPGPGADNEIDPVEHCAAFREHRLIRNAYVDVIVQKISYGATHSALNQQLRSAQRQLRSNPDVPAEDLARMALTIRTVERRLGLDSDVIITTYTLCPLCGRSYSPDYIADANTNDCQSDNCAGVLFDAERLASGKRKRVSRLTYPYASIITWIRCVLNQPGMSELIQNWRTDDDRELSRPMSTEEWKRNVYPDTPLGDMSNGWGWRSTVAGVDRVVSQVTGDVEDQSSRDPPLRFSSLPFGLSFSLNTDWFQPTKEGNYSVGACYLVLNNLPRHLRFLRENICLVLVMPGPKEPNDYALDQMLAPLIDELLDLKQGVEMNIRQGENPPVYRDQVVHAELSQHIADLIARIKLGGGAGLKSELNFCLYCRTRLSSLSVPAGFIREDLLYRDPEEDLNNAYYWRSLETAQERKAFFDFTGNRFTALHRLPGWHTSTCSPPDAMHLFYLGGMNWLLNRTLFQPGMLNKRRPTDANPIERFNTCIDTMWMPQNFSRLPPKLGQTNTRIKADQWKLATRVIFIPLFMAFRVGDTIPNDCVPRGSKSSMGAKNQVARAKALHHDRQKYYASIGQPDNCPPLEGCFPSRNIQFHFKQVLRYCVATGTLDKRTITPNETSFGLELLEAMCIDYARNNVPMPPNLHIMMHLEESILKYGSLYNSHVWGLERANGVLSGMNHNGRSGGMLEGTLMRGWWGLANLQNLIKMFHALPDRTPDDEKVLQDLLSALHAGPEHALERGTLVAYIEQAKTAYMRLYGVEEPVQLSKQSRVINLHKAEYAGLYLMFNVTGYVTGQSTIQVVVGIDMDMWAGNTMLHASSGSWLLISQTSTSSTPYASLFDVSNYQSTSQTFHGVAGTASWEFEELGDLEAVPVSSLSGTFALFEVPMSCGDYWVTVSLDTLSPARDDPDDNGEWCDHILIGAAS